MEHKDGRQIITSASSLKVLSRFRFPLALHTPPPRFDEGKVRREKIHVNKSRMGRCKTEACNMNYGFMIRLSVNNPQGNDGKGGNGQAW